jgi:hypothetical protein
MLNTVRPLKLSAMAIALYSPIFLFVESIHCLQMLRILRYIRLDVINCAPLSPTPFSSLKYVWQALSRRTIAWRASLASASVPACWGLLESRQQFRYCWCDQYSLKHCWHVAQSAATLYKVLWCHHFLYHSVLSNSRFTYLNAFQRLRAANTYVKAISQVTILSHQWNESRKCCNLLSNFCSIFWTTAHRSNRSCVVC